MSIEWSATQSAAPTVEPLTTAEAKNHLRVDVDAEDNLIDSLVVAARNVVEQHTGRQLITATWKLYLDDFPTKQIVLPRPPLQSVTSIEYVDTDGNTATWSNDEYRVDSDMESARITEEYGESWPVARDVTQAVTITYNAGYGDASSDMPEAFRQAIRLLVGHFYENREQVTVEGVPRTIPEGARRLLSPYRVGVLETLVPGE